MTCGMSGSQDGKQRTIAEDIDHPIEFPIQVLRELKFLDWRSTFKKMIFDPGDEEILGFPLLRFSRSRVKRDIPRDVRHAGDMVEVEVGHKNPFQGNTFRPDR